jgi:hypothetical protein
MGCPGQNFKHCLQKQFSPDNSGGLHQVLFSAYRTLESMTLENSKQHSDELKHTQRIIILLITVTVGSGEDGSVWLHKANSIREVHELPNYNKSAMLFNRDHIYMNCGELSTGLQRAL